jgi:hypothetical protein
MPNYADASDLINPYIQRTQLSGSKTGAAGLTTFGELSVAHSQVHTGWNFPYNINPAQVRSIEINGGTVTHVDNFGVVSTGTAANGVAFIRTEGFLTYTPGIGAVARFTAIFDTPAENSQQLIGVIDNFNGWAFGYNGLDFGILRRYNGVDTWVTQDNWNIDTRPKLDTTKGNVYEIRFQWLGFGMQYFAIEDIHGNLSDVHRIEYSNLNTDTSVQIASLPVAMGVSNGGNTTNISMRSPSAVALSQGQSFPEAFTTPIGYSYINTVSTGFNYLFTILNPEDYLTKPNKLYLEHALLTVTNETNKAITFTAIFNAVLTDPVYVDIENGITPAQYDESATAITNGIDAMTFTVPASGGLQLNLTSIFAGAKLWAESSLSLVAEAGGAGDVTVGYTFRSRV